MDAFDRHVRQCLEEKTAQAALNEDKKASLRKAMCQELQAAGSRPWRRAAAKLHLLLESTHQVSLAPVAAACLLLVVAGAGLLWEIPNRNSGGPAQELFFVSQTDSGMQIVPLDGEWEEK